MAMMSCVAFGGGGAVVTDVSVLCGAGGGLTVQPVANASVMIEAPAAALKRRKVVGTPFRVSGG